MGFVRDEGRSWGRNWERRGRSAGRMKTRRRAAAALKAQRGLRMVGCWEVWELRGGGWSVVGGLFVWKLYCDYVILSLVSSTSRLSNTFGF